LWRSNFSKKLCSFALILDKNIKLVSSDFCDEERKKKPGRGERRGVAKIEKYSTLESLQSVSIAENKTVVFSKILLKTRKFL
jgi:hypothetical protein